MLALGEHVLRSQFQELSVLRTRNLRPIRPVSPAVLHPFAGEGNRVVGGLAALAAGLLSSVSPAAAQFICQQYGGSFAGATAGTMALACGADAVASGLASSAFGGQTRALGDYSTAIGQAARAEGANAAAIGSQAQAIGANSAAVGTVASASGNNATAVGNAASAEANNATAIGNGASPDHASGVRKMTLAVAQDVEIA